MTEPKAAIRFYATEIYARGGRIPKKIVLGGPDQDVIGKQKEVIPKSLLVPRSLASLMC
jgi:hypothetical protein